MKIKLDYMGDLLIERNGTMKPQYCPYMSGGNNFVLCGDNCPMFGEPHIKHDPNDWKPGLSQIEGSVTLELCNGRILTCMEDEFTDNRNRKE